MFLSTRRLLDRAFSAAAFCAVLFMLAVLALILLPIFQRGMGAFVFQATIEHRKQMLEFFGRGNAPGLVAEIAETEAARAPVYAMLRADGEQQAAELEVALAAIERMARGETLFARRLARAAQRLRGTADLKTRLDLLREIELAARRESVPPSEADLAAIAGTYARLSVRAEALQELNVSLRALLGPLPDDPAMIMPRRRFGQARWERAQVKLDDLCFVKTWDYSAPARSGALLRTPRKQQFIGTPLEGLFDYVEQHLAEMLAPRWTFYARFLSDSSVDAHFFGGIGPETLGTIYLTLGAMLVAVPLGIIAAIYFVEYARQGRMIGFLRSCVSTLAGVPSVVFGLFGLAFFINTMRVSPSKSVLAGSLTLGLLVLPTVIRSAEEALMAVPQMYKEAAMSLGAGRWRTILTVILPAALPGILTGVVISMGRAAGETAPIIFTAAVSVGLMLKPWEIFTNPTPALSWSIYNLATEHEAADEIRHVQFGLVLTLITMVLVFNLAAIIMRARIAGRLKG